MMSSASKWCLSIALPLLATCAPAPSNGEPGSATPEPSAAEEPGERTKGSGGGGGGGATAVPTAAAEAEVPEEPAPPAWTPRPEDRVTPHQELEFAENLTPFFDRLAVVDSDDPPPESDIIRVVHLGASMIGNDDLPGILREKFQTRFGDGGAGLVLLSRYMPNYRHRWVNINANDWQHCYIAYLCKSDGYYGLGGTTFWSDGGAATTLRTRDDELGSKAAHFEVWYVAQPGGGKLEARIDRNDREVINTRADALEDRYFSMDVEEGPHKVSIRALGSGRVRGYGVVMETKGPGLVWDQFSMLGAFTKRMLAWDPDHIAGQIKHRDPDLIAFMYGGNDLRRVATKKLSKEQYVEEYSTAVQRVRAGKPDAGCLIIGLTDRGKSLHFTIVPEHVETIIQGQREVAQKTGCAFFDTYTAMGGGGSLAQWHKKRLAEADLKHLNHAGRKIVGGWIYDAIIAAYVAHRTGEAPRGGEG
jgi:lysophospholipase L1-like esterase